MVKKKHFNRKNSQFKRKPLVLFKKKGGEKGQKIGQNCIHEEKTQ